MNAHQIKRENDFQRQKVGEATGRPRVAVASLEVNITGIKEFDSLLSLLSAHAEELPSELVEKLKEWPEIHDVVQGLKWENDRNKKRAEFFGGQADKWCTKAHELSSEVKRLNGQVYYLQKIKRRLFKQLGLSRKGRKL